jgi:hypothetical protein
MEIENLIRYTPRAVGLKPSAMRGEARLRGLYRIISSKTISQGILALPVTLTLGPVAAMNWVVLTSFTLGGYATFIFTRRITGDEIAALVAGATFVCSPYCFVMLDFVLLQPDTDA